MFRKQSQDARDADTIAILAPRHAPDRLAAVAQLIGLMIGIERQRKRAWCAALPGLGPIGLAGADLVDQPAPVLFRPLPRLHLSFELRRLVHDGPPEWCVTAARRGR